MNKSNRITIGGAIFIALLFASFMMKFPVVSIETNGHMYWTTDKQFSLSWIHSVEKEEWIEFYEVNEQTLQLTHTNFKTFGAGVPSTQADGKVIASKDGFVTMEIHRTFQELHLVVSENVKSTLILGEKKVPLYQLTKDYEEVRIVGTGLSLWVMVLKGEKL